MVIQIIHLLVAAALIAVILVQAKGAGFGGILKGESGSAHRQRGMEKILFLATIILSVLFLAGAVVNALIVGQK